MLLTNGYKQNMRENLNRLSRGMVNYSQPLFSVSPSRIELSLKESDEGHGEILVAGEGGERITGIAISHNIRMKILNPEFSGASNIIKYVFDPRGIEPGEVMKGEISLLMNAGEFVVPYAAAVLHGDIESGSGPVRNLFHFTNLARDDFERASRIFYSEAFAGLIESSERRFLGLYRGFSGGSRDGANFESFLIATKKKTPAVYSVGGMYMEDNVFSFLSDKDSEEEVLINAEGWGCCDFEITSDAPFLEPLLGALTSADFENRQAVVRVRIHHELLHTGMNFGRLTFTSRLQSFAAEFCIKKGEIDEAHLEAVRKAQAYRAELVKLYISYSIKELSRAAFEERCKAVTQRLMELDGDSVMTRLFRAHALIISGKLTDAQTIITDVSGRIENEAPLVYGYYLYLTSQTSDDKEYIDECTRRVSRLYLEDESQDKLLWLLVQMDGELLGDDAGTLKLIKHHFEMSGVSVLLYLRAYEIYTRMPRMLEELGSFELQVVNFAAKTGLFDKRLMRRVLELSGRMRGYLPLACRLFVRLYEEYKSNEALTAVCTQLMKGERTDEEAFEWYSLAVERDLNITRLIEYYMYSVPEDYARELPRLVLMYFRYGAELTAERRALLYASIIRYHGKNQDMPEAYYPQMLEFAAKGAAEGRIDRHMALLYRYLGEDENFAPSLLKNIKNLAFYHSIKCQGVTPDYLVLVEDAFEGERKVRFKDGYACVPVYGRDYELFGEYEGGLRVSGDDFDDEMLLDPAAYERYLAEGEPDPGISVYFSEKFSHAAVLGEDAAFFVRALVTSKEIRSIYKRPYMIKLLRSYEDDAASADGLVYDDIDMSSLDGAGRVELIELLLHRGRAALAGGIIKRYGIGGVAPRLIMRMLSSLDALSYMERDDFVLWLCFECFVQGKYDEAILKYLSLYLEDTTKVLRSLWKCARDFEIDTRALEERMLIQMMYTGAFVGEREDIFDSYERHIALPTVELAWITLNAYDFVVMGHLMDERFFERLLRARRAGYEVSALCRLALIFFFSEEKNRLAISGLFDDVAKEAVTDYIREFLAGKVVFKAFLAFTDLVPELIAYEGSVFIEHRTDPASTVKVHYIISPDGEDGGEYSTRTMKSPIAGIFQTRFMLFYGEELQYYITEDMGGHSQVTESMLVGGPKRIGMPRGSRYEIINEMLLEKERGDDRALIRLIEVYRKRAEVGSRLFKPVE